MYLFKFNNKLFKWMVHFPVNAEDINKACEIMNEIMKDLKIEGLAIDYYERD